MNWIKCFQKKWFGVAMGRHAVEVPVADWQTFVIFWGLNLLRNCHWVLLSDHITIRACAEECWTIRKTNLFHVAFLQGVC